MCCLYNYLASETAGTSFRGHPVLAAPRPRIKAAREHPRLAWTGRGGRGVNAFRTYLETALAHLGVELAYQGERTCKLGEAFAHQGELFAHQGEVLA